MKDRGPRNKGDMDYPFGGGDETRSTPIESFDDDVAANINNGEDSLAVWPDIPGGVSESAVNNITEKRPVENNPALGQWPNPD